VEVPGGGHVNYPPRPTGFLRCRRRLPGSDIIVRALVAVVPWRIERGPFGKKTVLHGLAHDEESRATFLADAAGCADRFRLAAEQRAALIALDTTVAMGAHPLVPFLANMQVERQRRG
jgi:hypothetical protein